MRVLQSSWLDEKGIKLHEQTWEPDGKPKAVVGILHGLGEHVARYGAVAEAFVRAGFATAGFDLRGHGRSGGRRGHTPSYEALMEDIDVFLDRTTHRHPRTPIFLYGHSLGGALAINYALKRRPKLQGVIATAPWLRAVVQAPPLKEALARVLEPVLPTYTEHWAQVPADMSTDPEVVSDYEDDPLVHNLITARLYRTSKQAGVWALEHAAEFPLPLLLMHGTEDKLTSWEASREFARRLGKKVTWRAWEGWYHELHNEPARDQVVKTMIRWMNRQTRATSLKKARAGQKTRGVRKSRPISRRRA